MTAPRIPRRRQPLLFDVSRLCLRLLAIGLLGVLLALVSALSGGNP